ncbi:MAG: hypothetical protein HYZ27_09915, partial [Deltaproteobacteria bacterium]|nr:hypothetical protein [Deltaproteobacteria bacterium]
MRTWIVVVALAAVACGQETASLEDAKFPTGSATLIASADYGSLYVANLDQGTLTKLAKDGSLLTTLDLGLEPTRLARVGDRVLVTLRGERSLAVVYDGPQGLVLERKIVLGTEPFGVVADEYGERVYVALSTQNEVVELDGSTLAETQRWSVPNEPRFLALHPGRKVLYVGSAMRGTFTSIHVENDSVRTESLPEVLGFNGETFAEQPLTRRITGDLTVTSDGRTVLVPALYVDNFTPVPTVDELL